jgi:hypothetical protein
MHFKEYFENELLEDLFIEALIQDGVLDVITAPARFVGSAATNAGRQVGRGAFNLAKGFGKAGLGVGQAGLGALQTISGDPVRGIKTVWQGGKKVLSGVGDAAAGAVQIGASPASALARGVQAAGEPAKISNFDPNRNQFQKFFGLNSWKTPKEQAITNKNEFDKLLKFHAQVENQRRDPSLSQQDKSEINKKLENIRKKLREIDPDRFESLRKKAQTKASSSSSSSSTPSSSTPSSTPSSSTPSSSTPSSSTPSYDKDGYDKSGYDKSGYDREGYNREGYNRKGINREGEFNFDLTTRDDE